ncbi:DUF397 domain-containing protein [Streptomyces katsurahamanus]|uniref:DUF397 domain-containing protein n=1 Tax=Streptomyces katsurahamanus TaxID=2577098 RepID=A0ABW9P313_9ACTN|nr:DUF397 domain-containing protein [Streptomyces katsurahamanus]MQS39739.1 DUF397 domain-containing protein [Streptomyces katsurahamanus]
MDATDLAHAVWTKSSYSLTQCVEIARLPGGAIALRDSKSPGRKPLRFTADGWSAFRHGVLADGPLD